MVSLEIKDKNGQELFAGDTVQIVNGADAGKTLYNIRASKKEFYIEGFLDAKDEKSMVHIMCKKIMRLTKSAPSPAAKPVKQLRPERIPRSDIGSKPPKRNPNK
jgi:hypothetical protein